MRGAWFTGVCTLLAFGAAAYYANEAHKQSVTMNNTYCEIQKQTKAAQQQIKLMQEQLEGTMAAVLDVTGNINVTLPAQNVSLSELL
jgi:peptidoglycan hydrolase CwlO-like protein